MQLYWTYISVLCISGHIAVKYLHYSRHRRGEFAKCPQSKNNKEQSISLSLPFYEMTGGRRWFYCWNVESPELPASFSESLAAFMKCILILHHYRRTDFFRMSKTVTYCSNNKSFTALGPFKVHITGNSWIPRSRMKWHIHNKAVTPPYAAFCFRLFKLALCGHFKAKSLHWTVDFAYCYVLAFSVAADDNTFLMN